MDTLRSKLEKVNHSRASRSRIAEAIISQPSMMSELLEISGLVDQEISCRASWTLEYVLKTDLSLITPHIDTYLYIAPKVYKDAAVRPFAKICEFLTLHYYKKKDKLIRKTLTTQRREAIINLCFDWLITDQKVAAQAYSMTSLYELGNEFKWIHPELSQILRQNYTKGSAAYQARARNVLSKLKR